MERRRPDEQLQPAPDPSAADRAHNDTFMERNTMTPRRQRTMIMMSLVLGFVDHWRAPAGPRWRPRPNLSLSLSRRSGPAVSLMKHVGARPETMRPLWAPPPLPVPLNAVYLLRFVHSLSLFRPSNPSALSLAPVSVRAPPTRSGRAGSCSCSCSNHQAHLGSSWSMLLLLAPLLAILSWFWRSCNFSAPCERLRCVKRRASLRKRQSHRHGFEPANWME